MRTNSEEATTNKKINNNTTKGKNKTNHDKEGEEPVLKKKIDNSKKTHQVEE